MERSHTARILPPTIALLGAVTLTTLRVAHLRSACDANGLLLPQSNALLVTVLACVGFFLALTVLCLGLNRLPGTEACFTQRGLGIFPKLSAVALLLAGSALLLRDGKHAAEFWSRNVAMIGAASSLAMLWTVCSSHRGKSLFWARLLPALFTVAALIHRFREWSYDPLIIHITPALLAWICFAMESMLLSGFPLRAGHRRSSVLFGLAAGVFTCMAMVDCLLGQKTDLGEALTMLGLAIWCVTAALELLRPQIQAEQPAPEEAEQAASDAGTETELCEARPESQRSTGNENTDRSVE